MIGVVRGVAALLWLLASVAAVVVVLATLEFFGLTDFLLLIASYKCQRFGILLHYVALFAFLAFAASLLTLLLALLPDVRYLADLRRRQAAAARRADSAR